MRNVRIRVLLTSSSSGLMEPEYPWGVLSQEPELPSILVILLYLFLFESLSDEI